MRTYGDELAFLSVHGVETIELASQDGRSRLVVVPAWQGRVMTSTSDGLDGRGYGWINHKYIESGKISDQFNPFGGEERFWLGPEGGPFSWYFAKGAEQVYTNWNVPAFLDTEAFEMESNTADQAVFTRQFAARNASGNDFTIGVRRKVSVLGNEELEVLLSVALPVGVKSVAYTTENTITNMGESAWTKQTGMPSIWLLGMFNPTESTTVFIPYIKESPQAKKAVKDDYFGKVPCDRLVVEDGVVYFRIDGKYRSKIGLPLGNAKDICGSYDSKFGVLNILKYSVPLGPCEYVNSQWGEQEDNFNGDVINSYNDGPTETGEVMGPFYEMETSSPAAALNVGQSLTHVQSTVHIQGPEDDLEVIAMRVFGVDLDKVASFF